MKLVAAIILAGTQWAAVDGPQTLSFQAGQAGGTGGCNRYGASYQQQGNRLHFGPIMATRMACAPGVMTREQNWFGRLDRVATAEVRNRMLVLKDGAGHVLARLKRAR